MKYRFHTKPFDHQKRGLHWLWRKTRPARGVGVKGGAFFWDPGTGKSKAIIDYAAAVHLEKVNNGDSGARVLILCPINAMQVWPDQINLHLPSGIPYLFEEPEGKIIEKAEQISNLVDDLENEDTFDRDIVFLVLNFAATIKRDNRWEIMRQIERYSPELLVIDESHHIKNATTKQAKAAHKIAGFSERVVLATGTPIGANWLDLYSQLKAIDPNIWRLVGDSKPMTWTKFRARYAVMGGPTGYQILGFQNLDDLKDRYRPHVRSVRKRDVHDMPRVTDQIIPVELSASAREAYDLFAEEGIVVWRRHLIEAPIVLTKLLRLQQMTGGWVHDEHGEVVEFQTEKMATFKDLLSDLVSADRKVVVFARFIAEMESLQNAAENLGSRVRSVGTIRGGVSADRRRSLVTQFQGDGARVLIVQIGASEALDGLQRVASEAIFYSNDYSLIHWNQARGRLDRTGQEEPVTFYHIHVESSVDGLVFRALRDKKNLEKMVMDHPEILLVDRG